MSDILLIHFNDRVLKIGEITSNKIPYLQAHTTKIKSMFIDRDSKGFRYILRCLQNRHYISIIHNKFLDKWFEEEMKFYGFEGDISKKIPLIKSNRAKIKNINYIFSFSDQVTQSIKSVAEFIEFIINSINYSYLVVNDNKLCYVDYKIMFFMFFVGNINYVFELFKKENIVKLPALFPKSFELEYEHQSLNFHIITKEHVNCLIEYETCGTVSSNKILYTESLYHTETILCMSLGYLNLPLKVDGILLELYFVIKFINVNSDVKLYSNSKVIYMSNITNICNLMHSMGENPNNGVYHMILPEMKYTDILTVEFSGNFTCGIEYDIQLGLIHKKLSVA